MSAHLRRHWRRVKVVEVTSFSVIFHQLSGWLLLDTWFQYGKFTFTTGIGIICFLVDYQWRFFSTSFISLIIWPCLGDWKHSRPWCCPALSSSWVKIVPVFSLVCTGLCDVPVSCGLSGTQHLEGNSRRVTFFDILLALSKLASPSRGSVSLFTVEVRAVTQGLPWQPSNLQSICIKPIQFTDCHWHNLFSRYDTEMKGRCNVRSSMITS